MIGREEEAGEGPPGVHKAKLGGWNVFRLLRSTERVREKGGGWRSCLEPDRSLVLDVCVTSPHLTLCPKLGLSGAVSAPGAAPALAPACPLQNPEQRLGDIGLNKGNSSMGLEHFRNDPILGHQLLQELCEATRRVMAL